MKIRVRLFAGLREHAGWSERDVDGVTRVDDVWPVLDRDGVLLGLVVRVCGDRVTGEFAGVDVASSIATAELHVEPTVIASIGVGEIKLSVPKAELS